MYNASRWSETPVHRESYPSSCLADKALYLDQLRAKGYCIVEGLASDPILAQVNDELQPWFEATPRCQGDFYGWNTTRLGAVLLKSPASHSLVLNELILAIMDDVLGPHCDWYQLNLSQGIRIHPGERQQVPHRDEEMWPCTKGRAEYLVNVMWALSDYTAENGATLLWPRSHYDSLSRDLSEEQAVIAEMPRGSALLYLGSVTHCGGANRSRSPRTGLIFSYSLGWLKQYENAFLTYPPRVAREFSKQIRDLLGYRIHRPNLGGYEGQDPAVLFETDSHTLAAVDAIAPAVAMELQAHYANRSAAGRSGVDGSSS
jgi:ectoine hydroxylase-related dioxygenase (phytanoyl-CoA dioxygenase family)